MDALGIDLSDLYVEGYDDESAQQLYDAAGEILPIRPRLDVGDDGHDGSQLTDPSRLPLVVHADMSHDGDSGSALETSSLAPQNVHGDGTLSIGPSSSPILPTTEHGDGLHDGASDPVAEYLVQDDHPESEHIEIVDHSSSGLKRSLDGLSSSPQKAPRIAPSPASSLLGFHSFSSSSHAISTSGTSAFKEFASSSSFGTISSPCPVMAATSSAMIEASLPVSSIGPNGGRVTQGSFLHADGSCLRVEALSRDHWTQISDVATYRLGAHAASSSSHFMPQRVGSTLLPQPVSDFNRGIGSRFYVPPSVIRVREDGQDPSQARAMLDALVPPILLAEAVQRESVQDTAAMFDFHSFNAAVYGSLFRQMIFNEVEGINEHNRQLTNEVEMKKSELSQIREELEREREISSLLRKDKERFEAENASLTTELQDLGKEKEEVNSKVSKLESDLNLLDVGLQHKQKDFDDYKSSSQLEMNDFKVELENERKMKAELVTNVEELETKLLLAIQARRETLAAFPELFRRLLDYPGIKDVHDEFNRASCAIGLHKVSAEVLKRVPAVKDHLVHLDPGALRRLVVADYAFRAKAFPILEEIVQDLDVPIADIVARFAPPISPPAKPSFML